MVDDKHDDAKGSESQYITLKVLGQNNTEIKIKMKKNMPLDLLMKAYCERVGVSWSVARFLFDGHRIEKKDTPTSLEMKEGDTIDMYLYQIGGGKLQ